MKNKFYLILVAVIAILTLILRLKSGRLAEADVTINGDTLRVEVAKTISELERGLSGRREIAPGRGMLFVFNQSSRRQFWMKGMLIPIDIIWIDGNKIVDIAPNVPPPKAGEDLVVYMPRAKANFVLEVAAGGAELRGWKIGDEVIINY